MTWETAPDFEEDLKAALDRFDWSGAAAICDRLIRRIHEEPEVFPEDRAKKCLSLLRRKRRFRLVTLLAEALIVSGQRAPLIRRQYAQALIDQGVLVAPELVLQSILQDSPPEESEVKEARGLLGRIYKQLYVNIEKGAPAGAGRERGERLRDLMLRALSEYRAGYELNPYENYWHGVNVVALLARAGRDGLPIEYTPRYDVLAEKILITLADRAEAPKKPDDKTVRRRGMDAWELATAVEALVALGDYPAAKGFALEYTANTDADAFEIASTLRQLEEVWQLSEREPPGSLLLPICRAALLRREGGAFRLSPDAAALDLDNTEWVAAEEPQPGEEPLPLETLSRYRETLRACRAIARIETREGEGRGTGLLVSAEDFLPPGSAPAEGPLLLTNAHVVSPDPFPTALKPSEAEVVFQLSGRRLEVERVLWSSPPDRLDAALLLLRGDPVDAEPLRLAPQWSSVADVPPRTLLVGHPGGPDPRFSLMAGGDDESFSFQDAVPVDSHFDFLRYTTPRRGGSSGSAVFDPRDLSVVALHHGGRDEAGGRPGDSATHVNEATPLPLILEAAREWLTENGVRREVEMGMGASGEDDDPGRGSREHKSAKPPVAVKRPSAGARFYFALEGPDGREVARGRLVRYGADVDLVFNYSVPPAEGVIGEVTGDILHGARRTLTPLGVLVAPVGFAFRREGDAGFRVMNFYDGGARSDRLVFELRAADEPGAAPPEAPAPESPHPGFHVVIEVQGSIVYQFFLAVGLVSELPEASDEAPEQAPVSLDLDQLAEFGERAAASRRRMEAEVMEVLSNG